MNEQEFYEQFYEELKHLAEEQEISLSRVAVPKNNGILQGIQLNCKESNVAPILYPERYREELQEGASAGPLAKRVFQEAMAGTQEVRNLLPDMNRETAGTHLRSAVVGYENNREILKNVPHERVEDMALYARWDFGKGVSAAIMEGMLSKLHMTKEEVLDTAKRNSRNQIILKPLGEVMEDKLREEGMDEGMIEDMMAMQPNRFMYVFSTENYSQGAALAADPDALKQAYEELGEDFYILPSSVHETLLLPKSECPCRPAELKEMVMDINRRMVAPEVRLTDSVYEFDGCKLSLVGGLEMEQDMDMAEIRVHRLSR